MGTIERREREKEQRRNDIVDAAERIFFSKGITAATMDDVAEEAELSKGTLYLYFPGKESLYLAIHLRGLSILLNMFEDAAHADGTGLDKVRAIGMAYYDYYKKFPNYFNALIYYESRDIEAQDQDSIAHQCEIVGKGVIDVLVKCLQAGIEDGSIRNEIDPLKTAITLWGQSLGLIQLISVKGDLLSDQFQLNPDELMQYAYDIMNKSLKTDKTE
jgi:AcrR family transcriptional regulator